MDTGRRPVSKENKPPNGRPYVAVGFDGFIDTLVRPVKKVTGEKKDYFPTIGSFGQYLQGKASLSCSIDLDMQAEKPGGNTPLFAAALSELGICSRCVGSFGYPKLHPAFSGLGERVILKGIANPGNSTALEFSDGKVMMACNGELDGFFYPQLLERVGVAHLQRWLGDAQAAAFLNWSELPGSTSIWRGLLDGVLPGLPLSREKWLVLDISDCSRRSARDIRAMLELMRRFAGAFKVAFSLNHNEAMVICGAVGGACATPEEAARNIYRLTGVDLLALHMLDGAWGVDETGCWLVSKHRIEQPVLSTGGGDNFNAGLLRALLDGQQAQKAVAFANRVSSLYVQNGRSPTIEETKQALYPQKH